MPMVPRALRLIGTCVVAAFMLPALPAAAQTVPEYELKAAFVYNFALFAEWPADTAYEDGALNICISNNSALRTSLVALAGRSIRGRRIAVHSLGAAPNTQACQVIFLGSGDRERWVHMMKGLGSGVLTISDDEEIGHAGVVIALALEGNRIVFDIDTRAARRARVALSSKLLRLARTVQ